MMLGRTLLWKSWAGWFAQEALVEGQGTQSSFTHTWTGPAWGTLLLLLLLLLLAIRCYRRGS